MLRKDDAKLDKRQGNLVGLLDVASPSGVFRPFISLCSVHEPLFPSEIPGLGVVESGLSCPPFSMLSRSSFILS